MIYLLLLLPVVFLFVAFFVNAALFRPQERPKVDLDGRAIRFRSGRNELAGYLWNEAGTRGLLILAHGMGTDVAYHLPEIRHFAAQGYKVFAFEYSGYRGSTGRFYGFPQTVRDLKNAIEYIDDGSLPVVLLGHSMGAYAVCAVQQCRRRPVWAVVAYAPFYAPDEAAAEVARTATKHGRLLLCLIQPVQRLLFGKPLTAAAGLTDTPALILQGSEDKEVTPDGCALYAHRAELAGAPVTFRLIDDPQSSGHMTVIRKAGSRCVNADTMQAVDAFLGARIPEAAPQEDI